MKNLITILCLFFTTFTFAQQMTIQNMGGHYKLQKNNVTPLFYGYPQADSMSLRVTVVAPLTGQYEVNNINISGSLNYKLKGMIYISSSVIWWRKNIKISQTSLPTLCIIGINNIPIPFLKIN